MCKYYTYSQIMRMSELLMCCRINTLTSCRVWTLINLQRETDLIKCVTSEHCFTIVTPRSDSHTLSDAFQAAFDWFYGHEATCCEATSHKARRPEGTSCEAKCLEATKRDATSRWATRREGTAQEATTWEAATQEAMTHDAIRWMFNFHIKTSSTCKTLTCLETWTTWFEPHVTQDVKKAKAKLTESWRVVCMWTPEQSKLIISVYCWVDLKIQDDNKSKSTFICIYCLCF